MKNNFKQEEASSTQYGNRESQMGDPARLSPSMSSMALLSRGSNRELKYSCVTPKVIELGDVADRSCFNGQDL